ANDGVQFVEIRRERGKTYVVLNGAWTVRNAGAIERAIAHVLRELHHGSLEVIAEGVEEIDTSGALLLKKLLPENQIPRGLTEAQRALFEFLPAFTEYKPRAKKKPGLIVGFFSGIGETTL